MINLWNNFIKLIKNNRGIFPLVPLLAGAAAGFGLSKLRKKPKEQTIAPGIKPFSSQTQFPVGQSLNEVILAGLRGEGRGFGEDFVGRTTSPFVTQRLADLPQEQRDIQEGFSARGFGRSVLAGQKVGEARSQAGRDINQLIAQANLVNLQQQKTDEAAQIARGQTFAGQEVATRGQAAQFDLNTIIQQANQANLFQGQLQKQRDIEIGLPLKLGGQFASGQPDFSDIFGTGGGKTSQDDLKRILDLIGAAKRATPFTTGGNQ